MGTEEAGSMHSDWERGTSKNVGVGWLFHPGPIMTLVNHNSREVPRMYQTSLLAESNCQRCSRAILAL